MFESVPNLKQNWDRFAKHQEVESLRDIMDELSDCDDSSFDSVEHSYDALKRKYSRNQLEIRRLRNTVSFQLGIHLTTAVRQPWRLLGLPITFPLLALKLGLQRLGKQSLNQPDLDEATG